jgi:hypothetical protein
MAARKGRCRICGKPADHDHHAAGEVHLPDFTVPACIGDHDFQHVELRRWGVPLAHKHDPSQSETAYALIAGLSSVVREAVANVGEECADDAQTLDRLSSALLLDAVAAEPLGSRTFGPEPLAQAARRARPSSRRTAIAPDEFAVHLADLERFVADGMEQLLNGDEKAAEYVKRISAFGEQADAAAKWLVAVGEERGAALVSLYAKNRAMGTRLTEAVLALGSPEPTPEQLATFAVPGRYMMRLEECSFRLQETLAGASEREQALAAIDAFLAEMNAA